MNQVSDLHTRRTSHFASLAVHAILKVLIKKVLVLKAKPLPVRTGLFRTGVQRIDGHNRTVSCANRTFDALFEIIETYILLLHVPFNVK